MNAKSTKKLWTVYKINSFSKIFASTLKCDETEAPEAD